MHFIYPIELTIPLESGIKESEIDELADNCIIAQKALDDYYSFKINEDDLIAILESCLVNWEEVALIAEINLLSQYGIKS